MKVVYYNSGWPINIGNAFIDYGSSYAIKAAVPQAKVYVASELAKWVFWYNGQPMERSLDLAELADVDFVVISGMSMCDEFIAVEGPVLNKLSERGVKIVFSGTGGEVYTEQEVANFRNFLKGLNLAGFISRDEVAYKNFRDLFPISYSGIDCAFFLGDCFEALPLTIKDYVVYNFDNRPEPQIDQPNPHILRTHHTCNKLLFKPAGMPKFLLALHRRWPFLEKFQWKNPFLRYLSQPNTLISDMPDDYLHLYASVSAVYTDRVHACISTLAFGNAAMLYSKTPRAYLFERVGANSIYQKLTRLDMNRLKEEKQKQTHALKEILERSK